MCKIRNVQFLSLNDEGYQQYRSYIISRNRLKKNDHSNVQVHNTIDFTAAMTLERFVRNSIGHSERERILSYEVFCDNDWHRRYLECDYVRHLPYGGGLVIGEIKSSETYSSFSLGCGQLLRICELLKKKYGVKNIKLQLHIVEYTGKRTSHTHTRNGINIDVMYHPLKKLLEFANSKGYTYDETLIWETRKKVLENLEKEKRVSNEKIVNRRTRRNEVTNFGMLLNKALYNYSVA